MVLSAGALISRDTRTVELDIELPDGGGKTRQEFRVAGPGAYLAAKADALRRRDKNKDAYDVVWLIESWPGGQRGLAAEIRRSGLQDELKPVLAVLAQEFRDIDSAAPSSTAGSWRTTRQAAMSSPSDRSARFVCFSKS